MMIGIGGGGGGSNPDIPVCPVCGAFGGGGHGGLCPNGRLPEAQWVAEAPAGYVPPVKIPVDLAYLAARGEFCRRDDMYTGLGGAGVVHPPQEHAQDAVWLMDHCWVCGLSRQELAAAARHNRLG